MEDRNFWGYSTSFGSQITENLNIFPTKMMKRRKRKKLIEKTEEIP